MKRLFNKGKAYIKTGCYFEGHSIDALVVGYVGEGEAPIPQSLLLKMMHDQLYTKRLLQNHAFLIFEAVKHSQYIDFIPVRP